MIVFENDGLIDLRCITTFGVTVKVGSSPIGYFGTGLKYAIAVLLREDQQVTLYRGDKQYKFTIRDEEIRGEEFPVVYMNDEAMPFTTNLGKNWELWMAYRELYANALDEPLHRIYRRTNDVIPKGSLEGKTAFVVQGDEFDVVHDTHDEIFLTTHPVHILEGVEIHDGTHGDEWLYYRGIRVQKFPRPGLHTYNITAELRLTEDRTLPSRSDADRIIAKAIAGCDVPWLIRSMLEATQRHYESSIDYHWWDIKLGETFNDIVSRYISTGRYFNTSAKARYLDKNPGADTPNIVQWETIPMEHRRKLWAALRFWAKLGIEIPRENIFVTDSPKVTKGKHEDARIFIPIKMLGEDMRYVTGAVYRLYVETRPKAQNVSQSELLVDTIVDFGERLLGLKKQDAA